MHIKAYLFSFYSGMILCALGSHFGRVCMYLGSNKFDETSDAVGFLERKIFFLL